MVRLVAVSQEILQIVTMLMDRVHVKLDGKELHAVKNVQIGNMVNDVQNHVHVIV